MLMRSLDGILYRILPRTVVRQALNTTQLFAFRAAGTMIGRMRLPSLHSYALMSNCAYLPDVSNNQSNTSKEILTANQWEVKEFSQGLLKSGYVGCIFINHQTKQVVVAHAGTVPSRYQTLLADLRGIVQGRPDPLLVDALLQVHDSDVTELLKKGYYLSFTGHLLGGFLAELSVFACHRGLVVQNPQVSAVTFDSPGSLEIMEAWQSNIQGQRVETGQLNITSFVSSPNLVNTLYRHPGTVYRLIRDLGNQNGVSNSAAYLLESHNLSKMIGLFDPNTGLPKKEACCQMQDWPLADYSEVSFDLGKHPVSSVADLAVTKTIKAFEIVFSKIMETLSGTKKDGPVITLGGGKSIRILGRELGTGERKIYHEIFDTTSAAGLVKLIDTHYQATVSTTSINTSMSRVNFLPAVYDFLCIYNKCKEEPTYQEFLKQNGINVSELPDYSIEDGMVVTKNPIGVFELRDIAYELLSKHRELIETHEELYEKYFKAQVDKLQQEVKALKNKNLTFAQLEERLEQLKAEWSKVEEGRRIFMSACIVSEAAGTKVAKVMGKEDYAKERQEERERMAKTMKAMDIFMQGCVVIKTPDSQGLQLPNEEIHPSVRDTVRDFFGVSNSGTAQSGGQNTEEKKLE